MYERIITGLILIVAVIHLLPISGFLGVDRLASLYEIKITDGNLEILMRHRAILFGILGGFLAYAAFIPTSQPVAFIMASISVTSFLFLTYSVGEYNAAIQKVVFADIAAFICLLFAIVLYVSKRYG